MVPSARRENFPTAIRYSQIFPWKTFFATRHLSQVKREGSLCASYPLMLSNFKCELTIPVPLSWPVSIPYYFPRFGNIKNCRNSDPLPFFLLRFKPSFIELILLSLSLFPFIEEFLKRRVWDIENRSRFVSESFSFQILSINKSINKYGIEMLLMNLLSKKRTSTISSSL